MLTGFLIVQLRKKSRAKINKGIHTKRWVDTAHDKESETQMGLGALICSYQSGSTTRLYNQGHAGGEKM